MKFKAHNCKVIDTNKALVFDADGKMKLRAGGMKQVTVMRKLPNQLRRRPFVR